MNPDRVARAVTADAAPETWASPAGDAPWIASIGHSDHELDAFFALLDENGVVVLVDVRSHPRSYVERFSKPNLAASCRERGVGYHHLPTLGGLRDVPYATHMATPGWGAGYDRLRELAWQSIHAGGLVAFLCVERDPGDCHRRHIAKRLEVDGWRVRHILPDAGQTRLF